MESNSSAHLTSAAEHTEKSSELSPQELSLPTSQGHEHANQELGNGIHPISHDHGSSSDTAPNGLFKQEQELFENSCQPVPSSIPSEPDSHYHILIKLGLSTSVHSNVHKNVSHQKPCHKITIKLHENPSPVLESAQTGRNSDPISFPKFDDLFGHQDSGSQVAHEKITTTTVTPAVPRPVRNRVVSETLETQPSHPIEINLESSQNSIVTQGNFNLETTETPFSHGTQGFETTPRPTDDENVIQIDAENFRRSSVTTDRTVDSRRVSSAEEKRHLFLGQDNQIGIKSGMAGRPDTDSKERYRQTSLQIMTENKASQKCSCNIF